VHGVILDENMMSLTLTPPKALGEQVTLSSKNPELGIFTNVIAVDTPTSETLCQLEVRQPSPLRFEFSGCWPLATAPQTLKLANQFPLETAAHRLNAHLQAE